MTQRRALPSAACSAGVPQDEAQLVELSNGSVVANMRNRLPGHERGLAMSHDAGASFGDVYYAAGLPEPVCMASALRVGRAILFSNPGR